MERTRTTTPYKARESRRKSDVVLDLDDLQKPGLPPKPREYFAPTQSQRIMVAALAACNVGYDGIAAYIRVNEVTLKKYFRQELAEGYDRTEAALVGVLVAKALSGNMSAINTMLRCVFGWSETGRSNYGKATIEALTAEQRTSLIKALRETVDPPQTGKGTRGSGQTGLVTITGTANGSDRE